MRRDGEWWLEGRPVETAAETPPPLPPWRRRLGHVRAAAGLTAAAGLFGGAAANVDLVAGIGAVVLALTALVELAGRAAGWVRRRRAQSASSGGRV